MTIYVDGIDKPFELKIFSKANSPYYCLENKFISISFSSGKKRWETETFMIPEGFKTDLAKVPKLLQGFYPPTGTINNQYGTPALLHDYLYSTKSFDRKICDLIFLQAMKQNKCKFLTRYLFYFAVRIFGNKYYIK